LEIDPEVAALMNDLPASKLPDKLIEAGWGDQSMEQAMSSYRGRGRLVPPSTTVQPTFKHCAQCGLPVARNGRGLWMDHVGGQECDGALCLDKQELARHIPQDELDDYMAAVARENERQQAFIEAFEEKRRLKRELQATPGTCEGMRYGAFCRHECAHSLDHFGFHECKYCRKLWR
jgi:hypothetical protein